MIPLCLSVLPLQSAPSSSSKLPLQPHLSICLFKYSVPSKTCKRSIEFANLDSMFLLLLCLFSTSLTPQPVKMLTMSLRRWHSLQDASAEPLGSLWPSTSPICVSVIAYSLHLFPSGSVGKESSCHEEMLKTQVPSLSQENPMEKGMASHSGILAWRIPWTEEPGGLQFMGSQRVRQDWREGAHTHLLFGVWAGLCSGWVYKLCNQNARPVAQLHNLPAGVNSFVSSTKMCIILANSWNRQQDGEISS